MSASSGRRHVDIYDTTLRDGTQGEGVSYTVGDKLAVARKVDELGVAFIEGGWPGSNPRDAGFFEQAKRESFSSARLVAFGSTARPGADPSTDPQIAALLAAETPVVTIVAKTWDFHVHEDLRIELEENLDLIRSSVAFLKTRTDMVILDAEHFFDGWMANQAYAIECLRAAADGGADLACLCDTRGGSLPANIEAGVAAAKAVGIDLGIHCHDDSGLAVANSLTAIAAGAVQVQGTINGFGERCGNASLCTIIPNLELKMDIDCVGPQRLSLLTETSRFCAELANVELGKHLPYVGRSAFAHKGGLHVAAVRKNAHTYEHIAPGTVGNEQRVLVSDLSGRSNVLAKAEQFGIDIEGRADELKHLLAHVKELENTGFQFEGAEASFELLMRRSLGKSAQSYFKLISFRVIDEKRDESHATACEATVMIEGPNGEREHTAATGNGPVNALDRALRKALIKFYPSIRDVELHDYKVRVLAGDHGTESRVRVLIESGEGDRRWGTVGVSHNVVEASWQALVDALVYKLDRDNKSGTGTDLATKTGSQPAPTAGAKPQ
ncbi:MAG: 2-isopropylmalate synthase [Hyphomicrobiaceae bacterium]|jgi:2-isopropylmalate synthase